MITKRNYPWVAQQDWSNVLFLHWPVPIQVIQPFVPKPFVLDTYNGTGWISIVIFEAKNSRLRYLPKQFSFPTVTQINVRTYVKYNESTERGVYFFNLHIQSILAIYGAKTLFQLPFRYLQTETIQLDSSIYVTGKENDETVFAVQYEPSTEMIQHGIADFLTERYCIWHIKGNKIIKVPILHSLWNLQKVNAELSHNKLLPFCQKELLSTEPIAHFNSYKRTKLYPYEVYGYIK